MEDIETEYKKLIAMGVEIIEKPTLCPWGAVNMSFYGPDKMSFILEVFLTNMNGFGGVTR